jgi:hypothetical protein
MTLGAWIFLSIVLVLVVLNKPFRKFFLWAAAVSAVCCGLFFGYVSVSEWRERRAMAREAAIQQKKQDDCNARLNAKGAPNVIERLANSETCRANPDIVTITVDEARAAQHPTLDFSKAQPIAGEGEDQRSHLPPGYTLEQPARKSVHPKTVEGTVTKGTVVYSESHAGGPGGQVLGKVESGTHVRVLRLDSIYGNVQVRTPNGIIGWLSSDEINY